METYQSERQNQTVTIGEILSQLPAIVKVPGKSLNRYQTERLIIAYHPDNWHPDLMAESVEKETELTLRLQSINVLALKTIFSLAENVTSPDNPPSPTLIRALPDANGVMEAFMTVDMNEIAYQAQQAIDLYQTKRDFSSFDGNPAEKQFQWQQQEASISIFSSPDLIKPYIIIEQGNTAEVYDCYRGRKNKYHFDRQRNSWLPITDEDRKISYSIPLPLQEQGIERMEAVLQRVSFV